MNELGIHRAHLVGHSLGGAVVARLAARWPEKVDRLVLAAPAGPFERRRIVAYALPLLATARHAKPRFLRLLVTDAARAGATTLLRAGRELVGDDTLAHDLHAIRAPTLLVWGDHDPLVPVERAEEYRQAIPDARLVVVRGAGHVAMSDRPAEFAQTVLDFAGARPSS
jgi:pimeloyl-ACP methyl ester carboxylesterase